MRDNSETNPTPTPDIKEPEDKEEGSVLNTSMGPFEEEEQPFSVRLKRQDNLIHIRRGGIGKKMLL